MPKYSIEARSFRVAVAWSHNFWVLKNAGRGTTIAELHGLAYDRVKRTILPIGTTREHGLRVFVFAHDAQYASRLGWEMRTTRMYANSRAHVVYEGADGLERWIAAVSAMPLLDELDLTYPPFGFNILTPTINSNSAYRTFGEIMGVTVHAFPGALRPGLRNRMIDSGRIELAKYDIERASARAATGASRTS